MIIDVKNTEMRLVIPNGYKKLSAKNPLKRIQNNKLGLSCYQKVTDNANCVIMIFNTDSESSMVFADVESLIAGIHDNLGENQGLIVAENGVTERGYQYIYSIVRSVGNDSNPDGTNYYLRMNLKHGSEIVEIRADFTEMGTTGLRDSMGVSYALSGKLVKHDESGELIGWREDPYDSNYTKGLPMNLSEREGLDGLFPNHPLSQAREFVHAIINDELMIIPNDKEKPKEDSNELKNSKPSNDDIKISQEEMIKLIFSKDSARRFIPDKITVEKLSNKKEEVKHNLDEVKKKLDSTKDGILNVASAIGDKAKETQLTVLRFIHNKKNAKFLDAKLSAFEDGVKEGKVLAVDYVKKYTNFCLASTAISYYFARCDKSISEEEMLEIEYDLDSIIKNRDLPESLRNKLNEISSNKDITFLEVSKYLDEVGIDTLKEFGKDIKEIIMADEVITEEECKAKDEFDNYLDKRLELSKNE